MPILTGSPLNLTLNSEYTTSENVGAYTTDGDELNSLFNRPDKNTIKFSPWSTGSLSSQIGKSSNSKRAIHSDDIYDTSISNIIKQTSEAFYVKKDSGKYKSFNPTSGGEVFYPLLLKAADFAYLKNVGVYPNNRLIVCRRYDTPVGDDPLQIAQNPNATLISWIPEGEDFVNLTVGEEWTQAKASFTDLFNEMGSDIMSKSFKDANKGTGLGDMIGGGLGALPLPGFTEILQRRIFQKIMGDETFQVKIPSGTPNLIKEAKQRKLIGYDEEGSSLKGRISIKVKCEWEQKFISGIDPTNVWLDILALVLRFGSSPSVFYIGSNKHTKAIEDYVYRLSNDPMSTISELIKEITSSLKEVAQGLRDTADKLKKAASDIISDPTKVFDVGEELKQKLKSGIDLVIKGVVEKYKVRFIGVMKALTGDSSTPWHITVGNPLRPTFCSGDMLCEEVTITMGPNLAFNDLPSSIKAEFTLTNARNLGIQEIIKKFNTGQFRTIKYRKTIDESNSDVDFIPPDKDIRPKRDERLNLDTIQPIGNSSISPSEDLLNNKDKPLFANVNGEFKDISKGLDNIPAGLSIPQGQDVSGLINGNLDKMTRFSLFNTDVINKDANSIQSLVEQTDLSGINSNSINNIQSIGATKLPLDNLDDYGYLYSSDKKIINNSKLPTIEGPILDLNIPSGNYGERVPGYENIFQYDVLPPKA